MKNNQPKPCPWCGEPGTLRSRKTARRNVIFEVLCETKYCVGGATHECENEKDAIGEWNDQKGLSALAGALIGLMKSEKMRRDFEILSRDEFEEAYPDPDGYAAGDIDEDMLTALEKAKDALKDAGYAPQK